MNDMAFRDRASTAKSYTLMLAEVASLDGVHYSQDIRFMLKNRP
jgi:hypothetical protein